MTLDEILESLEGKAPAEAQEQPQDKADAPDREKSRLHYSDEFWARFQKPATAQGNDD